MSTQYLTSTELTERLIGALTKDLPATSVDGGSVLDQYLQDASAAIDEYCNWTFVQQTLTETLLTTSWHQAIIDANGWVTCYPVRGRPINTVTAASWQLRAPGSSGTVTTIPIDAADVQVDGDGQGAGWRVLVFQDFSAYRSRKYLVQFNLTYTAGYATGAYPQWLKAACLHWAAHLLKARGEASLVIDQASGAVVDASTTGGHLEKAQFWLNDHRRYF